MEPQLLRGLAGFEPAPPWCDGGGLGPMGKRLCERVEATFSGRVGFVGVPGAVGGGGRATLGRCRVTCWGSYTEAELGGRGLHRGCSRRSNQRNQDGSPTHSPGCCALVPCG